MPDTVYRLLTRLLGNVATALGLLDTGYSCTALSPRQLWADIFRPVRIATCLKHTELGDNPPVFVISPLAHHYQHFLSASAHNQWAYKSSGLGKRPEVRNRQWLRGLVNAYAQNLVVPSPILALGQDGVIDSD